MTPPGRPLALDTLSPSRQEALEALRLPEGLADPLDTAVAWLEHRSTAPALYPPGEGGLALTDRQALLESFRAELSENPLGPVVALEPDLTSLRLGGAGPVESLRAVAGELGHEILVVLRTRTREDRERNWLAFTHLLIWTNAFVPAEDVEVDAVVEACAIHVASGARLACAEQEAHRRVPYARPWRLARETALLRHVALREAMVDLSIALRGTLLDRMGRVPPAAVSEGPATPPTTSPETPWFWEDVPPAPWPGEAPALNSPGPAPAAPAPPPAPRPLHTPR